MIVFRDSRHLTATFAKSLAPDLERELLRFLAPSPATPAAPRRRRRTATPIADTWAVVTLAGARDVRRPGPVSPS